MSTYKQSHGLHPRPLKLWAQLAGQLYCLEWISLRSSLPFPTSSWAQSPRSHCPEDITDTSLFSPLFLTSVPQMLRHSLWLWATTLPMVLIPAQLTPAPYPCANTIALRSRVHWDHVHALFL